jgi:hypothetical protein
VKLWACSGIDASDAVDLNNNFARAILAGGKQTVHAG